MSRLVEHHFGGATKSGIRKRERFRNRFVARNELRPHIGFIPEFTGLNHVRALYLMRVGL
jgi:hypothetical protein